MFVSNEAFEAMADGRRTFGIVLPILKLNGVMTWAKVSSLVCRF